MKYSTKKVPSAKLNSTLSNTSVKPGKPKKVQRKTMEVSATYCMSLRSGNTIKRSCYYYRSYSTRTRPEKTGGKLKDPFCCTKVEQTESHEPPMTELSARRKQIPVYRENARRAQTNVIGLILGVPKYLPVDLKCTNMTYECCELCSQRAWVT
ncbi:interleukin-33-like [Ochotona curzoniae]|uniref:interleukin-33-like n=1 Tax=Ochotona curzoniae TaxID=130825 RepID=UPI001B3512EC|nr:interleukin-33-like [Ochotona curzoniae]